MSNVIDLFWLVVDDAKRNSLATDPINSVAHPFNSVSHPLKSVSHPLKSITHPANMLTTPNRGELRIIELKKLLDEYFPIR